jgi:hypothetical protein
LIPTHTSSFYSEQQQKDKIKRKSFEKKNAIKIFQPAENLMNKHKQTRSAFFAHPTHSH